MCCVCCVMDEPPMTHLLSTFGAHSYRNVTLMINALKTPGATELLQGSSFLLPDGRLVIKWQPRHCCSGQDDIHPDKADVRSTKVLYHRKPPVCFLSSKHKRPFDSFGVKSTFVWYQKKSIKAALTIHLMIFVLFVRSFLREIKWMAIKERGRLSFSKRLSRNRAP